MNPADQPIDYFGVNVPLMEYFGLRPDTIELDFCRTRLAIQPSLTNSRGDVHGGTIMAVFDFTLSAAARSHSPTTMGVATIEMTTHFLDSVSSDIIIEAHCLRRGKSIAFCEGNIIEAATGRRVAVARGSFKLLPKPRRSDA